MQGDYLPAARIMCNCMANNADSLSSSITSKAVNCDLLIL